MMAKIVQPAAEQVRAARGRAGLTQAQAAAIVHATLNAWQRWEQGERRMGMASWELFLLKTGQAALPS